MKRMLKISECAKHHEEQFLTVTSTGSVIITALTVEHGPFALQLTPVCSPKRSEAVERSPCIQVHVGIRVDAVPKVLIRKPPEIPISLN